MRLEREAIVRVFERRGDRRRARLAAQALPPTVDPVASAGVLSWLGLDPRRIDLTQLEQDPHALVDVRDVEGGARMGTDGRTDGRDGDQEPEDTGLGSGQGSGLGISHQNEPEPLVPEPTPEDAPVTPDDAPATTEEESR